MAPSVSFASICSVAVSVPSGALVSSPAVAEWCAHFGARVLRSLAVLSGRLFFWGCRYGWRWVTSASTYREPRFANKQVRDWWRLKREQHREICCGRLSVAQNGAGHWSVRAPGCPLAASDGFIRRADGSILGFAGTASDVRSVLNADADFVRCGVIPKVVVRRNRKGPRAASVVSSDPEAQPRNQLAMILREPREESRVRRGLEWFDRWAA